MNHRSLNLSRLLILGLALGTVGCSGRKSPEKPVTGKPDPVAATSSFEVGSGDPATVFSGDLPLGEDLPDMGRYLDPQSGSPSASSLGGDRGFSGDNAPLSPEVLAFLRDIRFEFDSYKLSSEAQEQLTSLGAFLRDNPSFQLLIEGHCDERGDAAYNLALGEKRALTVREFLAGTRVVPTRMLTVSYGEERPVARGHDEAAFAQNRCARFLVRRR